MFHRISHCTVHKCFFKNIQLPRHVLVAREFNTGDKRGEVFTETPGLIAMRTVISRTMTKCENGARRSILLADVKTAFL